MLDKGKFRKEELILAHKAWCSVSWWENQCQELEIAGHGASTVRKERMNTGTQHICSFLVSLAIEVDLPTSDDLNEKIPHIYTQRFQTVLYVVNLTISIIYHTCPILGLVFSDTFLLKDI